MEKNILVIKLGALGDVLRTTPILPAIKKKYPSSKISWLTKQNAGELLEGNPLIDKILYLGDTQKKTFDILYNFDIEEEATNLASTISALEKKGFYSQDGYPASFNLASEYYLNTLFDDELKKSNRRTYQRMIFDIAELPYECNPCKLFLSEEDVKYADNFFKMNKINPNNLIGIHMGASSRWPSKVWGLEKMKDFIIRAKNLGKNVIIFGGPNEIEKHKELVSELHEKGVQVYRNDPHNSFKQFSALINLCDVIVCSDSLAMHVSLSLKKPTISLFFCTSPHEVEGYGYLKKIVSPLLYDFFPEKMDQYDRKLVNSISPEEVIKGVEEILTLRNV